MRLTALDVACPTCGAAAGAACPIPGWDDGCVCPARARAAVETEALAAARRCLHCSRPIVPMAPEHVRDDAPTWELLSAHLAGYCGTMCQFNHARAVVTAGKAWWQRRDGGA